ncbi:MAG: diacylglycerol kinase family lipid kinase [Candidatus Marinimicrobia bacterium]|nr:diacylglycerol kinase family lipid kinase [Candidatus Neomarinimicrobiota bacterium]
MGGWKIHATSINAQMKKYYLIVNPAGGTKKGLDILEKVKPIFQKHQVEITILHTEYAGHARQLAKELDLAGYDGLCAIGGDGTMFEMVNGMLKRDDGKTFPLGLITGGTGNAFMHDLDCLDPIEAASRIVKGHLRPVDIAKVEAQDVIYYSFNIVGWGLVADAGHLAESLRWLGGIRYDVASILEVIKGRKRIARLLIEDEEAIEEDFIFIVACNTIHTGKAMRIAPHSKFDDGKIDLVIVRRCSRIQLLKLFPKLFTGEHIKSPLVEYRQVKGYSIIPKEDSALILDGELTGSTPVNVSIEPKRINVLV